MSVTNTPGTNNPNTGTTPNKIVSGTNNNDDLNINDNTEVVRGMDTSDFSTIPELSITFTEII